MPSATARRLARRPAAPTDAHDAKPKASRSGPAAPDPAFAPDPATAPEPAPQAPSAATPVAEAAPAAQPTEPADRAMPGPSARRSRERSPSAPRRLSALDAADRVLSALAPPEAAEGLSAGELIDRMAARGLWTSPGGKTPSATLYAAMLREIAAKQHAARFRRVGPGRFASNLAPAPENKADRGPAPSAPRMRVASDRRAPRNRGGATAQRPGAKPAATGSKPARRRGAGK